MSIMGVRAMTAAAIVAVALLGSSGCMSDKHRAVARPTPSSASRVAPGLITGRVDGCAGVGAVQPRPATVLVSYDGVATVSAQVTAGDPTRDHYRLTVLPGRYRVVASNWPQVTRFVTVTAGSDAKADFPNYCE